jgi:MFS family permease
VSDPTDPARPLLALNLGALALFTAFFMTGTLAPLFAGALGAPPAVIGVVVSATFLVPFLLAIVTGSLVDAVGPKPMLVVGTVILGAGPLLVIVAPSLTTLILVQVATGLGQLLAVVAAQALVASLGVGRERDRNFGVYGAFVSGGQLSGPLLAGVLVDLAGFRAAYVVATSVALVGVVAFAAVRASGRRASERAGAPADASAPAPRVGALRRRWALPSARDLWALTRLPTAQVSLWVSGTVMLVLVAHNSFLPAFLDELAVPASAIGVVLSVRSAASVLIRPVMAQVVTVLGGRLRTFVIAIAASAVGVAGIVGAPNLLLLLAGAALVGLAIGVAQPLTMVGMVAEVPVDAHGVAFGTRITANRLVQVVTPLLLGLLAQGAGYAPMFVVAAVAIASTAVGLIVRRRVFRAIDGSDGAGPRPTSP